MKTLASIILLTSILFTYGFDELNSDSADVSGTWLIPKDLKFLMVDLVKMEFLL